MGPSCSLCFLPRRLGKGGFLRGAESSSLEGGGIPAQHLPVHGALWALLVGAVPRASVTVIANSRPGKSSLDRHASQQPSLPRRFTDSFNKHLSTTPWPGTEHWGHRG